MTGLPTAGGDSGAWGAELNAFLSVAHNADGTPALDARYTQVFSPMSYGAVGNAVADDTTAVQSAFAAAGTAHGVVDLANYRFKTTAPIILPSGVTIRGGNIQGSSTNKGAITNNATDVFQFASGGSSGNVANVWFSNISIDCSAGHVFNMGPAGFLSQSAFTGCSFSQNGTGFAIFYSQTDCTFIGNFIGMDTRLQMAAAATVPAVYLISNGNAINTNTFQQCILAGNGHTTTVPFIHIENSSTSGYCSGNAFRDIECEELDAGIIALYGCSYTLMENILAYDTTTFTGTLFTLDKTTGNKTIQTTIRNSGSIGGTVSGSVYHVLATSAGSGGLLLENVGGESGTANLSIQPANTVIVNGISAPGVTAPAFTVSGITGATSGGRIVGTIASGSAPVTGTFATGDVIIVLTGGLIVCTAGGAPGTWVASAVIDGTSGDIKAPGLSAVAGAAGKSADASHIHPLQDPLMLGTAATFLPSANMAAQTAVANAAWYYRLLAGGYAFSVIQIGVSNSSGNICVGVYGNTGSGASAKPATQLQTSGSVPCPANGAADVALGGSVTPNLTDWLGIGVDNATATFAGTGGLTTGLVAGCVYEQTGLTGAVLTAPAGTLVNSSARNIYMRGH